MCYSEMRAFGEKLKEYRKQKGLTQSELANIIGVQNSAISKYERGRIKQIPYHILSRLMAVLEFDYKDIPYSDDMIAKGMFSNIQTVPYLPKEYKSRMNLTEAYLRLLFASPNPNEGHNYVRVYCDGAYGYFDHFYANTDNFFIISKRDFSNEELSQIQNFINFIIKQNKNNAPIHI